MSTQKTKLNVKVYPECILRRKAKPIQKITDDERGMLSEMAQLMYESQGVGLAANQVGIDKAMFVADPGNCLYKIVNPEIVKRKGCESMEEGCLSLPGIFVKTRRAKSVVLKGSNECGEEVTIDADGLLARIFQHETDHLNGKMIIDYAGFLKRLGVKKALAKLDRKAIK